MGDCVAKHQAKAGWHISFTHAQVVLGTHTEFCGDVADGEGWHDSHWYLAPVETIYCSLGRRCMKLHNVFFIVFHP